MDQPPRLPLLAVVGPTGSGKSDLGLALAEEFDGEIINYDSVQVYRGLDVGSAKTPEAKRRSIQHHLFDVADARDHMTAGEYVRRARAVLSDLSLREKLPILVGGTGFYMRALLSGLSPAPERDQTLRNRLAALARRRPGALHRFLRKRDAQAAQRIHPNDIQKLMRAIELAAGASERPARQALEGYSVLKIGLSPPRPQLYERLDARSACLFRAGLLEETKVLLDAGVPPQAKPLLSLGYKQAVAVLTGGTSLDEAVDECRTRTRQYAKRQMTWFRAEPDVCWILGFGDDGAVQEQAMELTRAFLER